MYPTSLRPKLLYWGLLFTGSMGVLAILPAIAPHAWLVTTANRIGLSLTDSPLDRYLAQQHSLLYAALGTALLVIACDIPRYLPLLRFAVPILIAMGCLQWLIAYRAGMPDWWIWLEGPRTLLSGLLLAWLLRGFPNESSTTAR